MGALDVFMNLSRNCATIHCNPLRRISITRSKRLPSKNFQSSRCSRNSWKIERFGTCRGTAKQFTPIRCAAFLYLARSACPRKISKPRDVPGIPGTSRGLEIFRGQALRARYRNAAQRIGVNCFAVPRQVPNLSIFQEFLEHREDWKFFEGRRFERVIEMRRSGLQ